MRRFLQYAVMPSKRCIIHTIDSKSFEAEVLQSQKAVCLVFYMPQNAACQQLIAFCDSLSEALNHEAGSAWLKFCVMDGDRNRNLASAMSVQRAKLPTTFFMMNATIVDRVSGNIPEQRMESILRKFSEHYHSSQGSDLHTNDKALPLAAATTADLTSGAPTAFLQAKIVSSLVGAEMIQLPEEAAQLEGIKKLIQQTKEKAFVELQDLHKSIGMDVRRLSDEELDKQYFNTAVYKSAAALAGLEALFLARVYGSVGQLERQIVLNAIAAVRREFSKAMGDPLLKKIMSLVDVNVVRGQCREDLPKVQSRVLNVDRSDATAVEEAEDDLAFLQQTLRWIDFIDTRRVYAEPEASGTSSDFPTQMMDDMFAAFRANVIKAKKSERAATRSSNVRLLLMALMQMFPTDPQSIAARARLSSMIF